MKKTFNFLGSLLLFATIVTSCSQDEIFKSEGNEQGSKVALSQSEYMSIAFDWGGNEDGFYMVDRNTTSLTFETIWNGHYNQNLKIYPNVRRK